MNPRLSLPVRLLKVIGNGPRSARDYTREESFQLMECLMSRQMTSAQLGALFLSMRKKTTTELELLAFIEAWQTAYKEKGELDLFVGSPFDGKARTLFLSPWAWSVLSMELGVRLSLGGSNEIGPKQGVRESQLLSFLPLSLRDNIFLWDASKEYDFYDSCLNERNEIGLRSFLHTVEKCVTPYRCPYAFLTIHHRPYIERFIRLAQNFFETSFIVIGEEGTTDLMWYRPTVIIKVSRTQVDHMTLPPLKQGVEGLDDFVHVRDPLEVFELFKKSCLVGKIEGNALLESLVHQVALGVMLFKNWTFFQSLSFSRQLLVNYIDKFKTFF